MSENPTSILGVAVRDIARLNQVIRVVVRHGFGEVLLRTPLARFLEGQSLDTDEDLRNAPPGVRLRRLFEALGPTWIKLGQILSMRIDLVPEDVAMALRALQDEAPVLTFEEVRGVVERELGGPIGESFADFDPVPLATASIAQAHLATTVEGDRVVVKVQRPGIERVIRGDLDLLYLAARIAEATVGQLQLYQPSEIIIEFERGLLRELNFSHELANLVTARQLLDPTRRVIVPRPHPELSGRTVLVMDYFKGRSLRSVAPGSPEAKAAVEEILHATCKQVFIDGFFHGDPHPGNILIADDGTLCMIDLGLVGRLTLEQREDLVTLTMAAIANDAGTMARVFLRMGTPTRRVPMAEFRSEITRIRREQLEVGSLGQVDSSRLIQEFVGAANRFGIKLNPEYSLTVKGAATLEGIFRTLHPEADVVGIARPYIEDLIRARYAPDRLLAEAMGGVTGVGSLVRELPGHIDQVLHDIETGNLRVQAGTAELDQLVPGLRNLGSRLALALFAASMTIGGAVLMGTDPFTGLLGFPLLGLSLGGLATLAWIILLYWHFLLQGQQVRITELIKLFRRT